MAADEWILEAKGNRSVRERKRLVATLSLLQGSETADETLAPQSVTGVFDEAFDLYKRHFGTFLLIAAVVLLPIQILCFAVDAVWLQKLAADVASQAQSADPDVGKVLLVSLGYFLIGDPRRSLPGILSFGAPFLVVSGPMAVAVSDSFLGRQPSARAAYRAAFKYFPHLIRSYMLAALTFLAVAVAGIFLISIVIMILTVSLGRLLPDVAAILILLLALIPYFVVCAFIARYFALITPVAVLEGAPALYVSGRNQQLVGKLRYRATFLSMVFLPLLTFGLPFILIYSAESALAQFSITPALLYLIRTSVVCGATCFLQPYWMIFVTLLYYDYRVKRECFDVRILSAKLQEMPPSIPILASASPPARPGYPGTAPQGGIR